MVRANLLAGESRPNVGRGEPINVGAGQEVSINRIAELIGGPVVYVPERRHDERFKRASIERAERLLGWRADGHDRGGHAPPARRRLAACARVTPGRRLLYLAHGFPPAGGSGPNRALAFARYLPGVRLVADGGYAGRGMGCATRRVAC